MTRFLIVTLLLVLLSLSGCGQSGSQPAEDAREQTPEAAVTEPQSSEEVATEVVREMAEDTVEDAMTELVDIPGLNLCTDPRPEICTMDYTPVCGVHDDGRRRTYSNACGACSNAEVVGSLPGPCPEKVKSPE